MKLQERTVLYLPVNLINRERDGISSGKMKRGREKGGERRSGGRREGGRGKGRREGGTGGREQSRK